jgi:uncharacterized protein (TIRG00374 family)
MSSRLDGNERSQTRSRFKRVTFTHIPTVLPQREVHKKRQFKRPGNFKPDPISLHGFHEISYFTPQNVSFLTPLLEDTEATRSQDVLTMPVHFLDTDLSQLALTPEVLSDFEPEQAVFDADMLPLSTEEQIAFARQVAFPSSRSKAQPAWQTWLKKPLVQAIGGLLVGVGLLVFLAHLVDLPRTMQLIQQNATTTRGLLFGLLASLSYLLAFCLRAMRWKLFLNSVGRVPATNVIGLFFIGVFLNFILPIRAGELAKSLILRRTAGFAVNQSLPTITMDKVMDLVPAFFIVVLVPALGLKLDVRFWVVLIVAMTILLGVIGFVTLTAWKRTFTISILKKLTGLVPGTLGTKLEHFAIGFVDSLLLSANNPRILLLALLLTVGAVASDGLYNLFAFWTIGYSISFGAAVFGYMVFNLFYIFPTPPGQVGSNEVVGLLIFTGFLLVPAERVTAMMVLFHLWCSFLTCSIGMVSLSAFGVKFSSMVNTQTKGESMGS